MKKEQHTPMNGSYQRILVLDALARFDGHNDQYRDWKYNSILANRNCLCPAERESRRGMLIESGGKVKPATAESRFVILQLEPKNQARNEEKPERKKEKTDFKQQCYFLMGACCDSEGPRDS